MWSHSWAQAAGTSGRGAGSRRSVACLTRTRRPCGCGVSEMRVFDICGLVRHCAAFISASDLTWKSQVCAPSFRWLRTFLLVGSHGGYGVGGWMCRGMCMYLPCTTRWLVAPASHPQGTEAPGSRSRRCRAPSRRATRSRRARCPKRGGGPCGEGCSASGVEAGCPVAARAWGQWPATL